MYHDHNLKRLAENMVTDLLSLHRVECMVEIFIITMTENYLIESEGFGMKLISTIRPDEEISIEQFGQMTGCFLSHTIIIVHSMKLFRR